MNKPWALFLDDERMPPEATPRGTRSWTIARSAVDALRLIYQKGMPIFISFDHDLGAHLDTGHDLAINIVNGVLDGKLDIPPEFNFYVHSQNPVGKANIEGLLRQFLDHLAYPDGVNNEPLPIA